MEEAFARVERHIGDDGMYVPWLDPSPVQNLLEYEMGAANFYYLLDDHRREVEELLAIMHAKRLQEYEIVARRTPAEVVIAMENTSSTLISPRLYRQYSLPQIRDYVDVLHRYGKIAVLHMCGHLKALLPVVRETGLDGINAVTPPPVGTTTSTMCLDAFGDDFLIFGGDSRSNRVSETEARLRRADEVSRQLVHAATSSCSAWFSGWPSTVCRPRWRGFSAWPDGCRLTEQPRSELLLTVHGAGKGTEVVFGKTSSLAKNPLPKTSSVPLVSPL